MQTYDMTVYCMCTFQPMTFMCLDIDSKVTEYIVLTVYSTRVRKYIRWNNVHLQIFWLYHKQILKVHNMVLAT